MKKALVWCVFCALLLALSALSVAATDADITAESEAIADELKDFRDAIPPEVAELLPEGFFSGDLFGNGAGVTEGQKGRCQDQSQDHQGDGKDFNAKRSGQYTAEGRGQPVGGTARPSGQTVIQGDVIVQAVHGQGVEEGGQQLEKDQQEHI